MIGKKQLDQLLGADNPNYIQLQLFVLESMTKGPIINVIQFNRRLAKTRHRLKQIRAYMETRNGLESLS